MDGRILHMTPFCKLTETTTCLKKEVTSSGNDDSNNSDNGEINFGLQFNESCARFLLTNARSIMPKMDSLKDAFGSLNLPFACITETWYTGGRDLRDHIIEVEGASGIRILQKSRDGRVRKRGGGVALAFNTALCNFKPRQLKLIAKEHEVMCAVGKVGKVDRKIVVFVTYIPPGMRANQIQQHREALAAEVSDAKAVFKDPVFIIAGDFNHRDITSKVSLVEQITQVPSGPTRGPNTINLVFTNTPGNIKECITLPPLETRSGNRSDHKCVYVAAEYKSQRKYECVVKMRRLRDAKREEAFADDLRGWNFDGLHDCSDVDNMWQQIEVAVDTLTERHFPLVRVRKRSNESLWITRGIRRLWKKKIRVYKKEGKSARWWDIDRLLQERIEKSRVEFVEKMFEEGNNGRSFYAATKRLAKAAVVPQWSVKDLFVGRQPHDICQEVLAYFGGVASGPPQTCQKFRGAAAACRSLRLPGRRSSSKQSRSLTPRSRGTPYLTSSGAMPVHLQVPLPSSSTQLTH